LITYTHTLIRSHILLFFITVIERERERERIAAVLRERNQVRVRRKCV
jgi:hypothetical protein